jgi:exopolysaccharide production protein ExoQ
MSVLQIASEKPAPVSRLVFAYLLLFPLLFFAVHRTFSFQAGSTNSDQGAVTGGFTAAASDSDSAQAKAENLLVIAICLVSVATIYSQVLRRVLKLPIIFLLPVWAMMSGLWSQEPSTSVKYGLYLLISTIFAVYLAERFSPNEQMDLTIFLGGWLAAISIFLVVFYPAFGLDHQGHEGAWQGIFEQKNMTAGVMSYMLIPAFLAPARNRAIRALYILSVVLILAMTGSRTGWTLAASTLMLLVLLRILGRFRRKDLAFLSLCVGTCTVFLVVVIVQYGTKILLMLGRDPTLTGRTQIWHSALVSIMKRPILGYGYDAFFLGMKGENVNLVLSLGWFVPAAHNGVLNVWLELGIVGVVLVLLSFAQACKDAAFCFLNGRTVAVDWYISILFLTLVESLDEKVLATDDYLLWLLYLVACIGLRKRAEQIRARQVVTDLPSETSVPVRGDLSASPQILPGWHYGS